MLDELHRIELYKQLNPNELSLEQFLKLEKEIKHPKPTIISDEYFDFKLWCRGLPSRQESFAEFVAKKMAKKDGAKVLEVGGGRTGRLSRILNEKGYRMTCIDPKLELVSSDIECIKGQFNYKTFDLSVYDYVIAQEPCEATEHVVRACATQNVPFMMALCGVPHRLISGQTPKSVEEWYDYLLDIASTEIKLRYVKLDPFLSTPMLRSNKF